MYNAVCITAACPRLASLVLHNVDISCDSFAPLCHLTTLTQISVRLRRQKSDVLNGLADVTSLRDLTLEPVLFALEALPLGFEHLSALVKLTGLTRLCLMAYDRPAGSRDPSKWNAALSALGGLTNLNSLMLGDQFHMTDAVYDGVRRLQRLAELRVRNIRVETLVDSPAAWLPSLQTFRCAPDLRPSVLLVMLPLVLPLPSLTRIEMGASGDALLGVSARHLRFSSETELERHALRRLSTLLASAAHITWDGLAVAFKEAAASAEHLTMMLEDCREMVARPGMHVLVLDCAIVTVRTVTAIDEHLPHVSALRLVDCFINDPALWAVSSQLSGLERLEISNSTSTPQGDLEEPAMGITHSGLEALVSAPRARPLTVCGEVFEDALSIMDAQQQRVHGEARVVKLGSVTPH